MALTVERSPAPAVRRHLVPLPRPAGRIRLYLVFVALRYALLALTYHVSQARLNAARTFDVVREFAPLSVFVAIFAVMALLCLGGALWPRERPTRFLLLLSTVVCLLFGLGLLFSWAWSPAIAAFLPAAGVDCVVSGMDYRKRSR